MYKIRQPSEARSTHAPTKPARKNTRRLRSLRGALEKNSVFEPPRSAAFVAPAQPSRGHLETRRVSKGELR
jgi:hypothetical protein